MLVTLLLSLASGCSVFESEMPEAPAPALPDQFGTELAGGALAAGDWVDDFGDPQLQGLVEEALQHNRKFLSALAKRDAASARYAAEFASRLPRVDLQAQAQRQKFINDIITSSAVDIDQVAYPTRIVLGAGINWELDLWGRVANQAHAARDEAAATILEVEAAGFSLAAQTTTQWFSLVVAEKRLALAERIADAYEQTVQRSRERYERGLVTIMDLRQAMAEAEGAQAELLARQMEAGRTRRSLEVLLGRYPANELQAAEALPVLPDTPAAGVPGQLIERRPDVAAAELRLRAADQRLLAAKKNLLPRFTISLFGGTQSKYRDLLFTDESTVWSIGGNAVLPLFDGGATRAGISGQRAVFEDAVSQYQDKVLSACLEVEDSLAAEALLRAQAERARAARSQLLAVVDSVEKRFELGMVDLRAVLAARRSAWQSEQRVLETELILLNNRVALYMALGGGIAEADEAEAATDTPAAEETTEADAASEALAATAEEAPDATGEPALGETAAPPAPLAEPATPEPDLAAPEPETTPKAEDLADEEAGMPPLSTSPPPDEAAAEAVAIPAPAGAAEEAARQRNLEHLLATDPLWKGGPTPVPDEETP